MEKNGYNRKLFSLISILASLFVYTGAIAIYLYANGWRLGNSNQLLVKTGVLTVQSSPSLADLYVNGEKEGRTSKSVSLPVGIHSVLVKKNGYVEWKKDVEIKEQKSTPAYPWLIKKEIAQEEILSLQDKKYINSWLSNNRDYIYILANEYIPESLTYKYILYRFDINTPFWNISTNPRVILTFDFAHEPMVEILLAPNGTLGVLTIVSTDNTISYILDATKETTLDTLTVLNINNLASYKMSWAQNNQYLMFESDTDIIALDINKQTRYLLIKKTPQNGYIWSTDKQGFFYKIEVNPEYPENNNVYGYLLTQSQMDGSESKVILSDLFFQKNQDYIMKYQKDTGSGKYLPFTNSPESTKTVGEIKDFIVNQDAKGIYIRTNLASYWYDIELKKYYLVSPYVSNLIEFSPDNKKLIFKDQEGFSVFTFKKEEGDHTVDIGAKLIKNIDSNAVNIHWLFNSLNISYIENNTMYICDIDGDNKTKVLQDTNLTLIQSVSSNGEKIVTFLVSPIEQTDLHNILINSYTIH